MVYHGPSQGCRTCKQRRKKCDETRPSCHRCLKYNHVCGGYEHDGGLQIRQYEPDSNLPSSQVQTDGGFSLSYKSIALKCSLPPRIRGQDVDATSENVLNTQISDGEGQNFALRAFLYEYCIISIDQALSRGFLDGLEPMLHRLGPQSNLAKACRTVAFASNGIKLGRSSLYSQAVRSYGELLVYLADEMENPATTRSSETAMIAILLGLCEIILADEAHLGNHNSHARGVTAMLEIDGSSSNILGAVHLIRSGHPIVLNGKPQNYGMFYAPCILNHVDQSLADLMLAFGSRWKKAEPILGAPPNDVKQIYILKDDVSMLNTAFGNWQNTRVKEIRPLEIGRVSQERGLASDLGIGYWPGRVDTYFDLYTAGIWNVSRTARLLLIFLTLEPSKLGRDQFNHSREHDAAFRLVEDMIASISYHLSEDIHVFPQNIETSANIETTGRSVGGLLLMHPIYIASTLSMVPSTSEST